MCQIANKIWQFGTDKQHTVCRRYNVNEKHFQWVMSLLCLLYVMCTGEACGILHQYAQEQISAFCYKRQFLPRCMECRGSLAILSVCLSSAWFVTKQKKDLFGFLPRCMECRRGIAMRILSVCPSVCLSVCHTHVLWQNGRKICPDFYTIRKII